MQLSYTLKTLRVLLPKRIAVNSVTRFSCTSKYDYYFLCGLNLLFIISLTHLNSEELYLITPTHS